MRDFTQEVRTALLTVCANVFFYYPSSFTKTPLISFFDNGNSGDDSSDLLTKISYQVDVWSRTVAECKTIATAVDTAMRGLGFRRSFSQQIYDKSGYRHQSMRFEGTYNAIDGKIYSR